MQKEVLEISKSREVNRRQRMKSSIPLVALVGYTNAGKSTIMNKLVSSCSKDEEKKVFEKDMLFATLETSIRKIETRNNRGFLLSDTVGFIDRLPHNLIKAFRSTLEEAVLADVLIHVYDASDENLENHIKVTNETLRELGADNIPTIYVYNKADKLYDIDSLPRVVDINLSTNIYMSAKHEIGIEELIRAIDEVAYGKLVVCEMLIPYNKGNVLSYFIEEANVLMREHRNEGTYIKVECEEKQREKYREYVVEL